jgi:hypothetical protein
LTAPAPESLTAKNLARLLLIRQELSDKFLKRGMSSEKHFSLPEHQKYFLASSPLAIVPTPLL